MREWFTEQAKARGLLVEADRNGNLWATRGDGPYLAMGSHLDSVPEGGAFDGPLGIATAFAALDVANSDRDIAVIAFAEEEGARFGIACLGSKLATGAIEPEKARALRDREGATFEMGMAEAGLGTGNIGAEPERLQLIDRFIEVHIEQGRGLVDLDSPLGLAGSIWPHGRWRLELSGRADHAGTTRMEDRSDPMVAFAKTVISVVDQARSLNGRATFGRLEVEPNATNAIPSRVCAWLDARAPNEEDLNAIVGAVGDTIEMTNESLTGATSFDPRLRERIAALLDNPPTLDTGAGHDAGILASHGIPAAMIFVRNPTGISHSPAEHASAEDCEAGVGALARLIDKL